MADKDPRDVVPDLVIPAPRRSNQGMPAVRPDAAAAPPAAALDDDLGLGMEIERGGALVPPSAPSSSRGAHGAPSAGRSGVGSGLEIAHRRLDPKPVVETGPSALTRFLARVVPFVIFAGTFAALAKLVHRTGGRSVLMLAPHAFDASSTAQSGATAGLALAFAIALGFVGLRLRPRSYAMVGSAGALVLTSLAMVTITLVSTDEHPGPADGALVIPWLVPLAMWLLGAGLASRGPALFLDGGVRRLHSVAAAIAGGVLVFAAFELSALAAHLP